MCQVNKPYPPRKTDTLDGHNTLMVAYYKEGFPEGLGESFVRPRSCCQRLVTGGFKTRQFSGKTRMFEGGLEVETAGKKKLPRR